MKNSTIRITITLVALLFLNIEAAQAGLVHKLKVLIHHEFPNNELHFVGSGLIFIGLLSYIIFAPVNIGNQKRTWLTYNSLQKRKINFSGKREAIDKISKILSNPRFNRRPQATGKA